MVLVLVGPPLSQLSSVLSGVWSDMVVPRFVVGVLDSRPVRLCAGRPPDCFDVACADADPAAHNPASSARAPSAFGARMVPPSPERLTETVSGTIGGRKDSEPPRRVKAVFRTSASPPRAAAVYHERGTSGPQREGRRMQRWAVAAGCLLAGIVVGGLASGRLLQGRPEPAPAPAPKDPASYRDVVRKALPAVVTIEVTAARGQPPRGQAPAPGEPEQTLGFGSGFLVDPSGVVLTNFHVVEGAEAVDVLLADGRKLSARDIRFDPANDLAVIKLEAKEPLPFLELGDSRSLEVGDRLLALGAPFGLSNSVTSGILCAKGRTAHPGSPADYLQTDAAVNPGSSGGPLVGMDGKAVGVMAAIKSRSGGFQGVAFAVPGERARAALPALLKGAAPAAPAEARRVWLGVQVNDLLDPEAGRRLGLPGGAGQVVTHV